MVRISTVTASGQKLTVEIDGRKARRWRSTFGTAAELIKDANKQFEKGKIDRYEYYCRTQYAINLCSVACTATLNKLIKYA